MDNTDLKNKIEQVRKKLIDGKGYLSSIDVLMKLDCLSEEDYESWRFG